jgi:hypothetical protein
MTGAANPVGSRSCLQAKQKLRSLAAWGTWWQAVLRLIASDDPARVGILPALMYEGSDQRQPKDFSSRHVQASKTIWGTTRIELESQVVMNRNRRNLLKTKEGDQF